MESQACVMQSEFLVDAILLRTKRGPSNKLARNRIRDRVCKMYFEEEHSALDIAKELGIHRNTVNSYIQYWRNEFEKQNGQNEIADYFYKQKLRYEKQRKGLLKKLDSESDFEKQLKLQKLVLSLQEKEEKFYLKFLPLAKYLPQPGEELVRKITRKLALEERVFWSKDVLLRDIIRITKCDLKTAESIVGIMKNHGLNLKSSLQPDMIDMWDFANLCGYFSKNEISDIEDHRARKKLAEKQEDEIKLAQHKKIFEEEFGDPKNWSDDTWKNYKRYMP